MCEQYLHYIDRYAEKYQLDEDERGELAVYYVEVMHREAAQQTADLRQYITARLDHYAHSLVKRRLPPNDDAIWETSYSLEDTRIIPGSLWEAIEPLLTPREYKVLQLRFVEDFTLCEVGQYLGVSLNRTRQIEYKALKKLRSPRGVKVIRKLFIC